MVPLQWRTQKIEDDGRLENESSLLNKGRKDSRITVTGYDLHVST